MPQSKELFHLGLISIPYYLISSFSIYVTIYLFIYEDQLSFFIAFSSVFILDKIISLIVTNWYFFLFDTLQIGFLYFFFHNSHDESIYRSVRFKVIGRVIPQLILDTIFFQGIQIVNSDNEYSYFLIQLNEILFLALLIFFLVIMCCYSESETYYFLFDSDNNKSFFSYSQYYVSLFSLFTFKNPLGVYLGLISPGITLVLSIWMYNLKEPRSRWFNFNTHLLNWIFSPRSSSFREFEELKLERLIPLLHYYTSFFRLCLIIFALIYEVEKNSLFEWIYGGLSLFLTLAYLIYHLKIAKSMSMTKFIIIQSYESLVLTNKYLSKDHIFESYHIVWDIEAKDFLLFQKLEENLFELIRNINLQMYSFYKTIIYEVDKHLSLSNESNEDKEQFYSETRCIPLSQFDQNLKNLPLKTRANIAFNRMNKPIIFTQVTILLLQNSESFFPILYAEMLEIYQIIAFLNHVSDVMITSPSQILYDLYAF